MPIETVESILSNKQNSQPGISSIRTNEGGYESDEQPISQDKQALLEVLTQKNEPGQNFERQKAAIEGLPDDITTFMGEYLNKIKELNEYHGNNN
jgi:hypothetical protein